MTPSIDIANYIITSLMIIFGLLILNWLLLFIKFRHIRIIQSRRPISSIIIGIAGCLGLFYERIFILYYWNITNPIGDQIPHWMPFQIITFYLSTMSIVYIVTYRAFAFYYDIKFNQSLEDAKWRLFIDPLEETTNWFLKTRSNHPQRYFAILLFILWFIAMIFTTIIVFIYDFNTTYHRTIIFISALLPVIILLYLWLKFPKYDDIFHIRDEIKIEMVIVVITLIIFFTLSLILNVRPQTFEYCIQATVSGIAVFLLSAVPTGYVLYKFKLPRNYVWITCCDKHLQIHKEYMSEHIELDNNNIKIDNNEESQTDSKQIQTKVTLKTILEDPEGFELFARHLAREFAIENLLFYLESAQWLLSFHESVHQSKRSDNYQNVWCLDIDFPQNAPQSRIINTTQRMTQVDVLQLNGSDSVKVDVNGMIVRKSDLKYNKPGMQGINENEVHVEMVIQDESLMDIDDYDNVYYLQCVRLFRKYISNDSYFCINISSKIRSNLYLLLGFNENDKISESDLVENLRKNLKENKEKMNGLKGDGVDKGNMRKRTQSHVAIIDDLFHIFDIPRTETFQLMNYAVTRFKHTKRYKAWIASKRAKK